MRRLRSYEFLATLVLVACTQCWKALWIENSITIAIFIFMACKPYFCAAMLYDLDVIILICIIV